MNTYIDILLIAAIYVFALDISGFWQEATAALKGLLTKGAFHTPITLKPFSCSLCMTFWTGVVYLLFVRQFTLPNIAFVALVAWLTPRIKDILLLADSLLAALFNLINNKL